MNRIIAVLSVSLVWIATSITSTLADDLTVGGVTYQDVRFGQIRGTTVTIFHKTGVASVPAESLPKDIQQKLGYDPEKARAAVEQAAKARSAQEARWREAGYVNIHGQWVSPQEAAKYLDRRQTSDALKEAISARETQNSAFTGMEISRQNVSMIALIQQNDFHSLEILTDNRRSLLDLKKYGHPSYQSAIGEFLGVCEDGVEIYRLSETADPEWFKDEREYDQRKADMENRRTHADEMLLMSSLKDRKARAEAFRKRIKTLQKDAVYHNQRGIDLKLDADSQQ